MFLRGSSFNKRSRHKFKENTQNHDYINQHEAYPPSLITGLLQNQFQVQFCCHLIAMPIFRQQPTCIQPLVEEQTLNYISTKPWIQEPAPARIDTDRLSLQDPSILKITYWELGKNLFRFC